MPASQAQTVDIEIPDLTSKQIELLNNPARILWIGAGTKTGKTTALALWIAQGILNGEPTAWCGPYYARNKTAYDEVKKFLTVPIAENYVKANGSDLSFSSKNGGSLVFHQGQNPEGIFGGGYKRVVVDEASRQPEDVYTNALTTTSATKGQIRLAFNLDHGAKNWAVKNLLRVQKVPLSRRKKFGTNFEDVLMFPTLSGGLVDQEDIERMKDRMPLHKWEALYLAKIPAEDTNLFKNLDDIFNGVSLEEPDPVQRYVAGIDLGRKKDYTVVTIMDLNGNVVFMSRFNQSSWALQCQKVSEICQRFGVYKSIVDGTGIGDPVGEGLRQTGLRVDLFIFTETSKRNLVENLIMACDKKEISIPSTPEFDIYRTELEAMEFTTGANGSPKYGDNKGHLPDTVASLALAFMASRKSRTPHFLACSPSWL